jgi:hypothetical protein
MIVAVIALLVALSGTAAAGDVARFAQNRLVSGDKTIKKKSLSGSRIRPRSVPGNRLRRDSLTSDEIAESRLRKVPLAARAQVATNAQAAATAATAGAADRLNDVDVVPVSYFRPSGQPAVKIADAGGLVLTAGCAAGQLSLTATTTTAHTTLAVTGTRATAAAPAGGGNDLDFGPGESFDVDQAMGDGSGSQVLGRVAFLATPGGRPVTGELWLDERPDSSCVVAGTLVVGMS